MQVLNTLDGAPDVWSLDALIPNLFILSGTETLKLQKYNAGTLKHCVLPILLETSHPPKLQLYTNSNMSYCIN